MWFTLQQIISVLEEYSVANWISDSVDAKPITCFVFLLGGETVPWKSTKQTNG